MRTAGLVLALAGLVGPRPARAEPAVVPVAPSAPEGAPSGSGDSQATAAPSLGAWSPGEPRPGEAAAPANVARERPGAAVVVATQQPQAPPSDGRAVQARETGRRNPRASRRWSAAAAGFGPTHGLGVVAEYLPHWVAGFGLGVGGAMRKIGDGALLGSGTVFAEIAILPVPFAVTPVIGAGFAITMGPLAEYLPGFAGSPPKRDEFLKLVPYGRFGLRVDLRRGVYLAGEIMLAPDNRFAQGGGTHPLPSFRIGFNFL